MFSEKLYSKVKLLYSNTSCSNSDLLTERIIPIYEKYMDSKGYEKEKSLILCDGTGENRSNKFIQKLKES